RDRPLIAFFKGNETFNDQDRQRSLVVQYVLSGLDQQLAPPALVGFHDQKRGRHAGQDTIVLRDDIGRELLHFPHAGTRGRFGKDRIRVKVEGIGPRQRRDEEQRGG